MLNKENVEIQAYIDWAINQPEWKTEYQRRIFELLNYGDVKYETRVDAKGLREGESSFKKS